MHKVVKNMPILLRSSFVPPPPPPLTSAMPRLKPRTAVGGLPVAKIKLARSRTMDNHVVKHNKLRFARKLHTLLLSKPRHYLPLRVLSKCRNYLSLPPAKSILSMVKRYPTLFHLCRPPAAQDLLSVCLSPEAVALAADEAAIRARLAGSLAGKLHRLLLLSSHRRLVLNKLVHLGTDLGMPADFRSRLCNDHPDLFRTVDTSYGRALELVATGSSDLPVPVPLPPPVTSPAERIIDRPPKFPSLTLRKGLNVKRKHKEFLLKFRDLPDSNPYLGVEEWPAAHTMEGEKRACAVVREVLAMTVEKRTLVDHLTHFRKEFGLPNKLRGMLVRHPELFYVSLKGMRDSVFLVEGYDHKGRLVEKDDCVGLKERLLELVREGKRMRRYKRNGVGLLGDDGAEDEDDDDDEGLSSDEEDEDDGFADLFETGVDGVDWEEFGELGDEDGWIDTAGDYWTAKVSTDDHNLIESW